MSGANVTVTANALLLNLGTAEDALVNKAPMMNIVGKTMRTSIARTFREEGSPSGAWPRLAASTLKKKIYTAGHKLLVLRGRLFGSITYRVLDDTLYIGSSLKYARVHQFGSADRAGGSIGAQAKIDGRGIRISVFDYMRLGSSLGKGQIKMHDKNGALRNRTRKIEGPRNAQSVHVGEHVRHQNIPARPYLVFRPEDPTRLNEAVSWYLLKQFGSPEGRRGQ